ncbi:hypothetical protein PYW07_000299 [Mythimna separata]|uniref:Uncharacterized protein n=1 Tax=Mythimna separata TaxID=271217 RepID=A0AAD7Z1C2_MYTSE|nr:hypothetical protein PYW07_000299 [Mythimna separata]
MHHTACPPVRWRLLTSIKQTHSGALCHGNEDAEVDERRNPIRSHTHLIHPGSVGVRDVGKKLQECRLRWYGHIMRRPMEYVGRRHMNMAVLGARFRGRPRKRWLDVVKSDMRANGLTKKDVEDRAKWRKVSQKADLRPGGRRYISKNQLDR